MKAIEVIKKVAESEVKKLHILELGIVTSTFPHSGDTDDDNYECNVKLKNRDLELQRVPIATQMIGLAHVPNIGDLVLLSFIDGNINAPVVIGRLYNDENRPPINKDGEITFKHPSGTAITINANGNITIESSADINIKAPNGNLNLNGKNVNINC